MKSKSLQWAERIAITAFTLFLFAFGIAFFVLPDSEFSAQENRALSAAPALTLHNVLDGSFTSQIADYYADQFPLRRFFVGSKAFCELALGKNENNSVIVGKDGYLIPREDNTDVEAFAENLNFISQFKRDTELRGIPCTVAVTGRSYDIMTAKLPFLMSVRSASRAQESFDTSADAIGLSYTDLFTPLRTHADAGEAVWYRTDHHWTTYGAYLAYRSLCSAWDLTPTAWENFRLEVASETFRGTTLAKSGMYWTAPDTILFPRYEGDEAFRVINAATGSELSGFYDRTRLSGSDQYAAFLGGNAARLDIALSGQQSMNTVRPKLLLIKDSFAHSLVPFLAQHYDIVMIDLRYYRASVRSLMEEEHIDRVLILGYLDSYAGESGFGLLAQ